MFLKSLIPFILIPIAFLLFNALYLMYPFLKEDNVVEEYSERVIEIHTGIDVDLSPNTPEENTWPLKIA